MAESTTERGGERLRIKLVDCENGGKSCRFCVISQGV
jgi:hypothetical protein